MYHFVLDSFWQTCYTLTMMTKRTATNKGESIMKNETVEEFMARGGRVTMVKPMKARGAQSGQKIKTPMRFMGDRKAMR